MVRDVPGRTDAEVSPSTAARRLRAVRRLRCGIFGVAVAAAGCASEGRFEFSDVGLTEAVRSALAHTPGIEPRAVHARSLSGAVSLAGFACSEEQRRLIETTAGAVPGVRRVDSFVHVVDCESGAMCRDDATDTHDGDKTTPALP